MTAPSLSRGRFAALAAGFAVTAPALAQAQTSPIRVGTIPIDNGAEVYYGLDRGIFKRAGLNIELQTLTNGGAIVAAVASQAIDVGFSNLFSIVTAFSKGIPIAAIAPAALYDSASPAQALLVRKDAPFKTAKDLNGKTIGVDGIKNITQVTASAYIDANGGDSSTVQWIEIPDPLMGAALQDKRIDAASAAMSDYPDAGMSGSPLRVFAYPYESVGKHFLASCWFSSKTWAARHPDLAKKFAAAIVAAGTWANANRTASGAILAKYSKLTPERIAMLGHNRAVYSQEVLRAAALDPVIAFSAKEHLIASAFPASSLAL